MTPAGIEQIRAIQINFINKIFSALFQAMGTCCLYDRTLITKTQ